MTRDIVTDILTQYHIFKGLKIFGQEGIYAFLKELQNNCDRIFINSKHRKQMCKDEQNTALQHLMSLEKKYTKLIKGWGCANNHTHLLYLDKNNVIDMTFNTYPFLRTFHISPMDDQVMAKVDITVAFIHSSMAWCDLDMKLKGKMVGIFSKLNPYQ